MAQPQFARADRPQAGLRLRALVRLWRPRQWIKNGLALAGLLFSGRLLDPAAIAGALAAFGGFCLASAAVYSLNDALDAEADRLVPEKRHRPVAAGLLSRRAAFWSAAVLACASLWAGFASGPGLGACVLLFLILNLLYSWKLKHVSLLDIMCVALGFVLRAVGGALAVAVVPSTWLLVCVMLLSLFLAVAKRRYEAATLPASGTGHRRVLADYPLLLLDELTGVLSSAVIVSYLLYVAEADRGPFFVLTGLFVIYGVFRYLYLVYSKAEGGSPSETLLTDIPLLVNVVLWAVTSVVMIYFL